MSDRRFIEESFPVKEVGCFTFSAGYRVIDLSV
jgi:hypothetical protein